MKALDCILAMYVWFLFLTLKLHVSELAPSVEMPHGSISKTVPTYLSKPWRRVVIRDWDERLLIQGLLQVDNIAVAVTSHLENYICFGCYQKPWQNKIIVVWNFGRPTMGAPCILLSWHNNVFLHALIFWPPPKLKFVKPVDPLRFVMHFYQKNFQEQKDCLYRFHEVIHVTLALFIFNIGHSAVMDYVKTKVPTRGLSKIQVLPWAA